MEIKIVDLVRKSENGCFNMIYWQASLTKDGKTVVEDHNISLFPKETTDPSFVPFEQVTETLAMEWLKAAVSQEELDQTEQRLLDKIENEPNPAFINGMPWA
jgi:hypothetical protein